MPGCPALLSPAVLGPAAFQSSVLVSLACLVLMPHGLVLTQLSCRSQASLQLGRWRMWGRELWGGLPVAPREGDSGQGWVAVGHL